MMKKKKQALAAVLPALAAAAALVALFAGTVIAGAAEDAVERHDLKVVTYNVCGLPDLFTYDRNLAQMKKRFDYIGEKLNAYDIIGLQEMFVGERSRIESALGKYFVGHGTDTGSALKFGSGVYTFSRWPISKIHYEEWRVSEGPDSLSHKGFVMVTTHLGGGLDMDVYNLHAQAGGRRGLGVDNMKQLVEAMEFLSFGGGRPVLLIGDFNCEFWDFQCAEFVKNSSADVVYRDQQGVDHIFYHENGSGWKIKVLDHKAVFTEKLGGRLVSDHNGFEVNFRFEKE